MKTEKELKARFKEELDKISVAELTSRLVQIPSYSFMENKEKEVAAYIYGLLQAEGIESEIVECYPGDYNVYARIPGSGRGKSLMLSGHIDTVPPYDMEDAFGGRIEDGKIYGRGTCDMKGPVASMIAAMIAFKRAGIVLEGDIVFAALADEEEEGRGVQYLVEQNGPVCDGTIMGEPTDMKIALGHKGLEWIDVLVEGFKVHGGNKDKGINAIEMASRFIQKIYTEYVPVLNSREYPVLGVPTINVGRIAGGDQPSTVPGECLIQLDRRCVPTETIEQVYQELEAICDELHRQDPRFKAVVKDNFADSTDTLPRIPFCTEAEDSLVTSIQHAMAEAEEGPEWTGELTAFPAWSDAGAISNKTGSHCVVMGPGDLSVAHSIHEYIYAADVQKAAWIYGLTAINYCI